MSSAAGVKTWETAAITETREAAADVETQWTASVVGASGAAAGVRTSLDVISMGQWNTQEAWNSQWPAWNSQGSVWNTQETWNNQVLAWNSWASKPSQGNLEPS